MKTYTFNLLYTDIRYNDNTTYNDNLNRLNLQLNKIRIIGDIQKCI